MRETLAKWAWVVAGKKVSGAIVGLLVGKAVALLTSDVAREIFLKAQDYGLTITIDPAKLENGLTILGMTGFVLLVDFVGLHKQKEEVK